MTNEGPFNWLYTIPPSSGSLGIAHCIYPDLAKKQVSINCCSLMKYNSFQPMKGAFVPLKREHKSRHRTMQKWSTPAFGGFISISDYTNCSALRFLWSVWLNWSIQNSMLKQILSDFPLCILNIQHWLWELRDFCFHHSKLEREGIYFSSLLSPHESILHAWGKLHVHYYHYLRKKLTLEVGLP